MVAINAAWGLGLAVVGGEVTPDDLLVSKVTGEVVRETIADKSVCVPASGGHGTERVAVDDERRRQRCLDEPGGDCLVELARRVEGHFGSSQDVEWALERRGAVRAAVATGHRPARTAGPPGRLGDGARDGHIRRRGRRADGPHRR